MKAKIDNRFHQLEVAMRQAQSDIKKLAKAMELNKQAIIRLENDSEQRLETLEEWSKGADDMLTELNHALPDPEYDAKCEAVADIEASLDRHRERLGLNKPQFKQLDQSVFDGLDGEWQWAAIDKNSKAWRYREKPHVDDGYALWLSDSTEPMKIGEGYDATNWQDSLIERESKELTGSDLCRKMLERGDKFVVCKLADTSEADAISNSMTKLVTEYDGDGFYHELADSYWYFAVPINNQGEPLTAADVGL